MIAKRLYCKLWLTNHKITAKGAMQIGHSRLLMFLTALIVFAALPFDIAALTFNLCLMMLAKFLVPLAADTVFFVKSLRLHAQWLIADQVHPAK